jgi:hypothetical protein
MFISYLIHQWNGRKLLELSERSGIYMSRFINFTEHDNITCRVLDLIKHELRGFVKYSDHQLMTTMNKNA